MVSCQRHSAAAKVSDESTAVGILTQNFGSPFYDTVLLGVVLLSRLKSEPLSPPKLIAELIVRDSTGVQR